MKYKNLQMFFDCDAIACCYVNEVLDLFPNIDEFTLREYGGEYIERDFNSFTWDIGEKDVIAVADLQLFVDLYNEVCQHEKVENLKGAEMDFSMVVNCSVCDLLLMPDDECYTDYNTGAPLCDKHAIFDEELGAYKKPD
jgi:hypothetical protein